MSYIYVNKAIMHYLLPLIILVVLLIILFSLVFFIRVSIVVVSIKRDERLQDTTLFSQVWQEPEVMSSSGKKPYCAKYDVTYYGMEEKTK